uniref:CCHC-type domain-containing protein n=1 Tax=Chromera velia CCMP2878 TaxID=1169474 RepID=A0A0G4FG64_9ALVE|eukprot:Cvel_16800.t1-p1 / transcript=Cvel_16800.t1 / gene=Cvel_16800 / organism=Chromera_velia_CCMP2878 / gene_product=hypothetical protein / transcript_product=hypothetical protein / location=Cvel_scaffold1311:43597-46674(-) / protein_length=864 / sequence_SO=supercontig / SO=protein_coding / is_pseudo=false
MEWGVLVLLWLWEVLVLPLWSRLRHRECCGCVEGLDAQQTILRITLKQEQHDPEAILREIKELVSVAGNSLVQVLAGKKPSKQVTRRGLEIALFAGPGEIGPRVPSGLRGRGRGHGRGNGYGREGRHGGSASGHSSGGASEQPFSSSSRGGGQAERGRGGLRVGGRGGSQSGQGSSGSTFKGKCHNCKQYGHKQADCPDLQQSSDRVGMVADRQGTEMQTATFGRDDQRVDIVDGRAAGMRETAWMMQVRRPARSSQREFWESNIAYLDTGASRSIFPEYYRKYVIWSEEINREINQAETGVKLKVYEDALFRFPFTEKQTGLCMHVHYRAYLVRDREDGFPSVEPLLRPHKLVLMETAADSWFTIIDAVSSELKKFRIDCSRGDPFCNIPYVVMQSAERVYTSPHRLSAISYETAMTCHRRLLHCGEERLVGTLKKNGLVAWRDVLDKLGKTKQLAAEYNIYLKPSPPHCPESHGAVEVANREIRTMLRTVLKEIGCDAYVWPVLIPGIEQTHNVTFAPLTGVSLWFGRFQSPSPFVLRFGDPVVFKPPSADKSLSFPGMEGVFNNTVNDTLCEVLYYPPETERWTVCKLHPIVPKPVRWGVEEAWLGRAARRTGRGNGDGVGGGTEDGEKNKYGCNYYKDIDYKFEEIPEPMVPLMSVEEVSRSRPVRGTLAEINGVLQPVQLIGKMGKKSAEVALMRKDPLGMWRPSEICHIEKAKIVRLFTMMDGEVPKKIMDTVQKSEIDGNGTGAILIEEMPVPVDVDIIPADFTAFLRMRKTAFITMATPMKFSGGTAWRPATRKEINSGIFNGALIKEWAKIFLNSVLGKKVDRDEVVAVLPLSARFTWKENGETGEKDTNARMYS